MRCICNKATDLNKGVSPFHLCLGGFKTIILLQCQEKLGKNLFNGDHE